MTSLDRKRVADLCREAWSSHILETLLEYIKVPNQSPHFDPDWSQNGHLEQAVELARRWCEAHSVPEQTVEVHRIEGRTPVLLIEVPGSVDDTVLLYGHLDKQPPMTGWRAGLGPYTPVIEDGKLYGRGGADDGYAVFASLTALHALREQGLDHARAIILIEASEESGSPDLPAHIESLKARIGTPSLVVCLDSGSGNYEQVWSTTSLRGMVNLTLRVDVLSEGVHSGDASGIVPSSFRLARQLLARVEDDAGRIRLPEFHCELPEQRVTQARVAADALGDSVYRKFPLVGDTAPSTYDLTELVLRRTWRPTLSVTGAGGLPGVQQAGNVLRPFTELKLSFRLPPLVDANRAASALEQALGREPPSGCKVTVKDVESGTGWHAPPLAAWLGDAVDQASQASFGKPAVHMGEGGSIPFMAMLGERFPAAQFLITGVLGPGSNAHGPNEFLHLAFAEKLTSVVADVLARHARR